MTGDTFKHIQNNINRDKINHDKKVAKIFARLNHDPITVKTTAKKTKRFLRFMQDCQEQLIKTVHYHDFDKATKARADAVLNGTYTGRPVK